MAVQIAHINKSFGSQQVLRDVTLSIPEGQVLGLLGPNGAGKSTLMKILIGLWRADSGQVSVPERIGYLPENNPLYEEMYVTEYLRFMAKMTNDQIPMTNVDALIDRVGLTPERHKHIRELSKGYRQRVGLAQALLGDPQLLILDEPTTGLDQVDNKLLTTIIDKFRGGPVGLNTIATAMGEDAGTIEDVYEPYLIKEGFIKRTPRGREATELAYKHLGKTPVSPDGQQSIF